MRTKKIMRMDDFPLEKRWSTALRVLRRMIDFRQHPDLSEAVMQTDPDGSLILKQEIFDGIKAGMSVEDVLDYVGIDPYREFFQQGMCWYTMGGSSLSVSVNLARNSLSGKSLCNILAEGSSDGSTVYENFEQNPTDAKLQPEQARAKSEVAYFLSTAHVVKYFLLHSNSVQRDWLVRAMEAVPKFEIKAGSLGPLLVIEFDDEKPVLNGDHVFQRRALSDPSVHDEWDDWFLEYYFDGDVPEPFGVRNTLTEAEADTLWRHILAVGTSEDFLARRRLLKAIRDCNNYCTAQQREALAEYAHSGKYETAEAMAKKITIQHQRIRIETMMAKIRAFEASSHFKGREYKKTEHVGIWTCYQQIVFERDDDHCQHCGRNSFEVEGFLCLDHITPLSKGGETCLDNLQLLCGSCNSKKGMKSEDEFPPEVRAKWYKNRSM